MITLHAVLSAGIHHYLGSDNIGLQENARVLDGTVYVAFCRKIHYDIRFFFLKQGKYRFSVTDIHLFKAEVRIFQCFLQGLQIPRIGQLIDTYNPVFRMLFKLQIYKIGSNKSGSAGHDNRHTCFLTIIIILNCCEINYIISLFPVQSFILLTRLIPFPVHPDNAP